VQRRIPIRFLTLRELRNTHAMSPVQSTRVLSVLNTHKQGFLVRLRNALAGKPFSYLELLAKKPQFGTYPKKLVTLGDHIRERRLEPGLFQKGSCGDHRRGQ